MCPKAPDSLQGRIRTFWTMSAEGLRVAMPFQGDCLKTCQNCLSPPPQGESKMTLVCGFCVEARIPKRARARYCSTACCEAHWLVHKAFCPKSHHRHTCSNCLVVFDKQLLRCSGCREVRRRFRGFDWAQHLQDTFYCGSRCQALNWPLHRQVCYSRQMGAHGGAASSTQVTQAPDDDDLLDELASDNDQPVELWIDSESHSENDDPEI